MKKNLLIMSALFFSLPNLVIAQNYTNNTNTNSPVSISTSEMNSRINAIKNTQEIKVQNDINNMKNKLYQETQNKIQPIIEEVNKNSKNQINNTNNSSLLNKNNENSLNTLNNKDNLTYIEDINNKENKKINEGVHFLNENKLTIEEINKLERQALLEKLNTGFIQYYENYKK